MIAKLILKLVFKATVPVVAMVGLMSYGMYMKGGDPAGMFTKLAGNAMESAKSSVKGAGDALPSMAAAKSSKSKTTVYKWVDEHGVTQFGSAPPDGIESTEKTYTNKTYSSVSSRASKSSSPITEKTIPGSDGEKLPGIAGANLPVAIDPAVLADFLNSAQQPRE